MIAKLTTGNGFFGAASYMLRNGKNDEEKAKVKVLAAVGVDFSIDQYGNIVLDAKQVARDFRFQAMMRPAVRKPVYDIALAWKVGEHVPSDEKLARTVEFLQMIGFDNTQYVIVEHEKDNEHSHAIANIVDNDGNRISTIGLIDRMHAAAREITKKYGYQWGDTAKKETIEKAHKPHEKIRYIIRPMVQAAVAKANDIGELPELLASSGVGCMIKYSNAGVPVGISFSYELDGQLHTFRGSDLARSLSAKKIQKTIEGMKTSKVVWRSSLGIEPTRIVHDIQHNIYILQKQVWGGPVENGKYTQRKWKDTLKFTSFKIIGKDAHYNILEVRGKDGKVRQINQYGNPLTQKQKSKFGVSKGR